MPSETPNQISSKPQKSFLAHARIISLLTLISRILGMARESVSAKYFGAGIVSSAFIVAFSIPNMFRKLFGEGALSAAFIPLYTKALKEEQTGARAGSANEFAAASVNLLTLILLAITIIGEIALWIICMIYPDMRGDWLLTVKFTAVMLPYVMLICGTAFLSSILQVHHRFAMPAFAPVILNVVHIVTIILGAKFLHIQIGSNTSASEIAATTASQTRLAFLLSAFVLVAGVLQVMILIAPLRQVGFRLKWVRNIWTPSVKQMLLMSLPVALSASVLQISVLMDKSISLLLANGIDKAGNVISSIHLFGTEIRCPMEIGAAARLNWAQFLYQFPLGVFAIALATAIFPKISDKALDSDQNEFKGVLRMGIEATLFEGFAASIGLMVVRYPIAKLLFLKRGMTVHDIDLIAQSVLCYSSAIWAFSLLQIVNRGFFALHDTRTPLIMSVVNIVINLVVELPLVWVRKLGESGMAIGTAVSFAVQTVIMLYILDRKLGGLQLGQIRNRIIGMFFAALVMGAFCVAVQKSSWFPARENQLTWILQLVILMSIGALVYLRICRWIGVDMMDQLLPKKWQRNKTTK